LFGQVGIIATHSLGELVETTALLACQPLPAGRRVAIVSNAGGAGVLGGVATDVLGDHIARLSPLTDTDAASMISGVRAAPLLAGHRGSPAVDTAGLADILLRVSRLVDDLPEVAELDLNPVIARPQDAHVVDVRVRIAPAIPRDPFLRRLR
jgi:acyl-CoA synthetase (NDP forming)